MRSFTTEGIVIKRRNMGEADRVLTVFTKDHGKLQIKAKGVRKITSKRSSHIELLNFALLSLHKGNVMSILTEVQTIESFSDIKIDLKKVGIAYHICELVDGLCPENQENSEIFLLLKNILTTLNQEEDVSKPVYTFQLELLAQLGYWSGERSDKNFKTLSFIEDILERKLKTRQILPSLL
ncbi:MAG TPA: DNA repair protein RecO [Candidatus Saccharimonadales bacterium]|nr:DNA repair protein RecO [Candidatus Saccharimonadales bacterium]